MRTHPTKRALGRSGFSIIEMVVTLVLVGIMATVTYSTLRVSEQRQVEMAATQLVRDLEFARTRALSTRQAVRVRFHQNQDRYRIFLDHNDDGAFSENQTEMSAVGRPADIYFEDGVIYAIGTLPQFPGHTSGDPIPLSRNRIEFDERGLVTPTGDSGLVYLTHEDDRDIGSVVVIYPSGTFRAFIWRDGAWH